MAMQEFNLQIPSLEGGSDILGQMGWIEDHSQLVCLRKSSLSRWQMLMNDKVEPRTLRLAAKKIY